MSGAEHLLRDSGTLFRPQQTDAMHAGTLGRLHRVPRIGRQVARIVDVHVVRLSIGHGQHEFGAGRLTDQCARGVPQRGTESRGAIAAQRVQA